MTRERGSSLNVEVEALDLARGACIDNPTWSLRSFVSAAIREKVKRMKLSPKPCRIARRGRPAQPKATVRK